jgi:hypothetical protein
MLASRRYRGGTPIEVFDQLCNAIVADRSQLWKDLSLPFYGCNRPGAPHGMCTTLKHEVNEDLLAFIKA